MQGKQLIRSNPIGEAGANPIREDLSDLPGSPGAVLIVLGKIFSNFSKTMGGANPIEGGFLTGGSGYSVASAI